MIYTVVDWLFENLKYLNIVESFKYLAIKAYPRNTTTASRIGVDMFIIIKWITVILLWNLCIENRIVNIIIWYLIFTNIYTYFYYHIWTNDLNNSNFDLNRIKRRFLNLMQAIAYNIFCFAYLYAIPFSSNFKWTNIALKNKYALLSSIANSFTVEFGAMEAINNCGHVLILLETSITFVFLTIILSNSIPQYKTE